MKNILKTDSLTIAILMVGFLLLYLWSGTQSETSPHCRDCPGETCLCILGVEGDTEKWMLSPEVGE